MIDFSSPQDRQMLLREIDSPENKARKALSLMQYEIYNDRQGQYVLNYLRSFLNETTVREMPIISSINLARRILTEEASIYSTAPKRKFYNMTEDQEDALNDMYELCGFDDKMANANFYFKGQGQVHIQWVLKRGKIYPRVLLPHHLDAIPRHDDPEESQGYLISTFDKTTYLRQDNELITPGRESNIGNYYADGLNQKIADPDDWRKKNHKFVLWTEDFNFMVNEMGEILSEETENPIGIMPIIEVSEAKDFEYWVRQGQSVADFSVQFNAMLSDIYQVVRLQSWGQAVFSGPEDMMPDRLTIGTNTVLRLPIDPNNPVTPDFKFVTSGADIQGSLESARMLLTMFLSSRGIDPKTVTFDGSGGESFSSGIERLLSLIEKFEASKQDMALFKKAEQDSFEVIKRYINTYQGTEFLDWDLGEIPEDAYMTVEFQEPQMIETKAEKRQDIRERLELGLLSRIQAYQEMYGVDEETAVRELTEINGEISGP